MYYYSYFPTARFVVAHIPAGLINSHVVLRPRLLRLSWKFSRISRAVSFFLLLLSTLLVRYALEGDGRREDRK